MSASEDPISRLRRLSSIRSVNAGQVIVASVLIVVVEFFAGAGRLVRALFDFLIRPLAAFAEGVGTVFIQLFASLAGVLEASGLAAEAGFQQAIFQSLGPFNFWIGVVILGGTVLMLAFLAEFEVTSNLIPFTLTDFEFGPIRFGAEEDEE